jgi:lipid A disaccharide synthetase
MTNLQKIKELLLNSNLSQQEQDDFFVFLSGTRDTELEPMVKLFTENPIWIEKVNKNFKAKQKAVLERLAEDWQKIINEEVLELEKLEN